MIGQNKLIEIAGVFFKLGCIAFGGPAAHIAMMDKEIVEKRKWITREHFLDLIGATNLIPGPNSTEMTMHCGYERGGIPGLFVAGISFITPAVIITGLLAYLYIEYGDLPEVKPFIYGIQPAVIAIVAGAVYKLAKKALKSIELGLLAGLIAIASFLPGTNEVLLLLGAGIIGAVYFSIRNKTGRIQNLLLPLSASIPSAASTLTTAGIFFKFLKVGSILYGSGYVLFAYLESELVQTGYLTNTQLLDAIAVGQFTPGPVLSTSTFIGYQIGGFYGAAAATAGIFLPSFLFVLLLNPLIKKMRQLKILSFFLDSVNAASVAIMFAVLITFGIQASGDWRSICIASIGILLTFGPYKMSTMLLVITSSLLGALLSLIG